MTPVKRHEFSLFRNGFVLGIELHLEYKCLIVHLGIFNYAYNWDVQDDQAK